MARRKKALIDDYPITIEMIGRTPIVHDVNFHKPLSNGDVLKADFDFPNGTGILAGETTIDGAIRKLLFELNKKLGTNNLPSVPLNLNANAVSTTEIDLAWEASTDDGTIDHYEYRINGGSPVAVGNVLNTPVNGLTPSTLYSFEVRAIDNLGVPSGWSNVAQATTLAVVGTAPNVPQNPRIIGTGGSGIIGGWDAPSGGAAVDHYILEWRWLDPPYPPYEQETIPFPDTSFNFPELIATDIYEFKVAAVAANGEQSAFSPLCQFMA